MNIIAVANRKSGCGKTTTAINLAAELGRFGKRVLLIDMDPQAHATLGMGITGRGLPGLREVFCEKLCLPDVVVADVSENVDLVPANISLATVECLLAGKPARERKLLEQIEALGESYDAILIDCPPSFGFLSVNALRAARQVIAPLEPDSLDGIEQLQEIVNRLCLKYQLNLPVTVVPVMFDAHARGAEDVLDRIREQQSLRLSDVAIRHTVRVREAAYVGKPLTRYAPDCSAALDYRRLAQQLCYNL